LVGKF